MSCLVEEGTFEKGSIWEVVFTKYNHLDCYWKATLRRGTDQTYRFFPYEVKVGDRVALR